jgi:preprotein translocase subunit SecD
VAAPQGQLRVSRYFAALAAIIVVLYALVFFTGTGSYLHKLKPRLGLDLQGGTTLTLTAASPDHKAPDPDALEQSRQIIANRVNGTGVTEAEVVTEGKDKIVISVPGQNNDDVKRVGEPAELRFRKVLQVGQDIGAQPPASPSPSASGTAKPTPSSSAKPGTSVKPSTPATPTGTPSKAPGSGGWAPSTSPSVSPSASTSATPSPAPSGDAPADGTAAPTEASVLKKLGSLPQLLKQVQQPQQLMDPQAAPLLAPIKKLTREEIAVLPAELQFKVPQITCAKLNERPAGSIKDPKKQVVACDKEGQAKYLLDKATVVGTDVKNADFNFDPREGGWKVDLKFKGDGQDKWTQLTKDTFGKPEPTNQVAVVLDNQVVSAPAIQGVITGDAQITGKFTKDDANDLAQKLKYGALRLTFKTGTSQTISPTLGLEQLKSGLLAGGIGLLLVVVYSLIYYRALGFVTIASLVVSASIIYGAVLILGRQIGLTLTLAGVAGFIVAVGITADSFVVFFERLKDEVKEGRSVRTAVPRAWVRARRTILSADSVSFLAAAVLYILAIGAVKGFAFTLGLSTAVDVLIVFLFTHPLVSLLARSRTFTSPRISGLGSLKVADTPPPASTRTRRVTPKES